LIYNSSSTISSILFIIEETCNLVFSLSVNLKVSFLKEIIYSSFLELKSSILIGHLVHKFLSIGKISHLRIFLISDDLPELSLPILTIIGNLYSLIGIFKALILLINLEYLEFFIFSKKLLSL